MTPPKNIGYIQFIVKEVPDTFPQLLDNVLRILLQLLGTWRNAVTATNRQGNGQDDAQIPVSVTVLLCSWNRSRGCSHSRNRNRNRNRKRNRNRNRKCCNKRNGNCSCSFRV